MPKAIKYNTKIYDGILAYSHGIGSTITEFFLPDYNLAVNQHYGLPNVIEVDAPRTPINQIEVEVEQSLVNLCLSFQESKKALIEILDRETTRLSASLRSKE